MCVCVFFFVFFFSGNALTTRGFFVFDGQMLVDDIGDVTITNDGATILKLLEVEHPAAKILVELAELQDREVGDGLLRVRRGAQGKHATPK